MALSSVTSEAILFFDHRGITKSMLYSDFEAILDGMVGVPEFADREVRAAYCLVNGQIEVLSLVLFTIEFGVDGMADTTWNVPLRHLAEHAGQGPDMGAGPIRLACRSQCPVAWHQDQMWDPAMKPGANDFILIRDTLKERGPKMGLEVIDQSEAGGAPEAAPTLAPEATPRRAGDEAERQRLARIIKKLRLRVQTLENAQDEKNAKLRYAAQQKEDILNAQLQKVLSQFNAFKSQNRALREQNESLKGQVESLTRSLQTQSREHQDRGDEVEALNEQYNLALEQRLEEERAKMAEQIHSQEMDVLTRDDVISQLREQIRELKRNQNKVAHSGAQKMLEELEELGLSFIAFHPGAGHISVAASEVSVYMDNPVAFAARKCLVTEDHYLAWLDHYENPVCQVPIGAEQQPCGKRVIRVEVPNQFKPGVSDCNANRCSHCHSDAAIDNVLRFR